MFIVVLLIIVKNSPEYPAPNLIVDRATIPPLSSTLVIFNSDSIVFPPDIVVAGIMSPILNPDPAFSTAYDTVVGTTVAENPVYSTVFPTFIVP